MATPAIHRRRSARRSDRITGTSVRFEERGDLAAEIAVRPVDAFAERIAHKTRDLDRGARLALALLDRLRNRLVRIVDVSLLEQADLFVERLEARLDDLVDDVLTLSLCLVLVCKHVLLAPDHIRIETRGIDRLRVGGGDVHRQHAAEAL